MSNMMELNKAAQARSDEVSKAARLKCLAALMYQGGKAEDALKDAMIFDPARTAVYVARFVLNSDTTALMEGICAIHGQWARACLELAEKPNEYRYQSELGNI